MTWQPWHGQSRLRDDHWTPVHRSVGGRKQAPSGTARLSRRRLTGPFR